MNDIYKDANLPFSVTPKILPYNRELIRFSSQDKGIARLVFEMRQGKNPYNLTGVTGEVTLVMANGSRFIEEATILDPTSGTVEYILTDEQLRCVGKAKGELILKLPNQSSVAGFLFEFVIEASLKDKDLEPIEEYYFKDFIIIKEKLEGLESEVDDLTVIQVNGAKKDTEGVVHASLDSRIVSEVGKLETKQGEITTQLSKKASQTDLVSTNQLLTQIGAKQSEFTTQLAETVKEVNGIKPTNGKVTIPTPQVDTSKLATKTDIQQLSLTFKESYATLNALKNTYPNGDNANHVVLADNMIYTYKNDWISTGIQANGTGIANQSVTYEKRTFLGHNVSVNCTKKPANYDTVNGTLTIYRGTAITHGKGNYETSSDVVLNLSVSGSLHIKIVFDVVTATLYALPHNDYTNVNIENCLLLGTINHYYDNRKINLIFECTINGINPHVSKEKSIPIKSLHLDVRVSRIILNGNGQFPNVNTTAKTLTFYNETILVLSTGESYVLPETIIDLSANASSALKIYFDTTNRVFVVKGYGDIVIDGSWLFVCAVRRTSGALSIPCPYNINGKPFGLTIPDNVVKNPLDAHVKAIIHRGYNLVAPENTIPAYTLCKKMGFSYVETDVRFTSDGIPVLIHDETVDRTSNGTGDITTMTLTEVKALDFGSWKSAEYTGTQIPTFEEFILCCKKLNLHPYIHISTGLTTSQAPILTNIVKRLGMSKKVSWISYINPDLDKILALIPHARVGRLSGTLNETIISEAKVLKTSQNEVFLNVDTPSLTKEMVEKAHAEDILVETYTVNIADRVEGYVNQGVVGITTDSLNIAEILGN